MQALSHIQVLDQAPTMLGQPTEEVLRERLHMSGEAVDAPPRAAPGTRDLTPFHPFSFDRFLCSTRRPACTDDNC